MEFIMKKQILAAAVAASMTTVALADIAITGSTLVNFKNTQYDDSTKQSGNAISTEHNLKIVGKNGDTAVTMTFEMDDSESVTSGKGSTGAVQSEDLYLTTKVGDVAIKVGDWDNGDNTWRGSSRTNNQLELSSTIGPVGVTYASGAGEILKDKITLKTDLNGYAVKYVTSGKDSEFGLSGSVAGVDFDYYSDDNDAADEDVQSVVIGTKLNNVGLKVASITADSGATISGNSWAGDYEDEAAGTVAKLAAGMDVTAVELSTDIAGNAVKFRHIEADKDTSSSEDRTWNKLIVTRPLASGATLEVQYVDAEFTGSTAQSYNLLDLELGVKF
jgi:hypothetical protein